MRMQVVLMKQGSDQLPRGSGAGCAGQTGGVVMFDTQCQAAQAIFVQQRFFGNQT